MCRLNERLMSIFSSMPSQLQFMMGRVSHNSPELYSSLRDVLAGQYFFYLLAHFWYVCCLTNTEYDWVTSLGAVHDSSSPCHCQQRIQHSSFMPLWLHPVHASARAHTNIRHEHRHTHTHTDRRRKKTTMDEKIRKKAPNIDRAPAATAAGSHRRFSIRQTESMM